MLLVHREASGEHEPVCPQPSACPSHFWWLVETVSRPPSPQFSSSASPDCLNECIRFPITFWSPKWLGFSWSAPWRVPNPSKLFRKHPLLSGCSCLRVKTGIFLALHPLNLWDSESTMILGLRKEFSSCFSFLFLLSHVCSYNFACFSFSDKYGYSLLMGLHTLD